MIGFVDGLEMGNNTKVDENNSFKVNIPWLCVFVSNFAFM